MTDGPAERLVHFAYIMRMWFVGMKGEGWHNIIRR